MWSGCCTLAFLAVFLVADATHFRGSAMSWRHVGNPTGRVNINFQMSWRRNSADGKTTIDGKVCDDTVISSGVLMATGVQWACLSKNCGQDNDRIGTMQFYCTSFSEQDNWSAGSRSIVFDFPVSSTSQKFLFGNDPTGTHSCCWTSGLRNLQSINNFNINFYTEINLSPRPDNGLINNSPVTTLFPVVYARTGCEQRLHIPHADPDFDRIQCRWSDASDDDSEDECGGICHALDSNPSNAQLNTSTCEIVWTPPLNKQGYYPVAVVLEDFIPNPTRYLSEIPLQFLIQVVEAELPCSDRPEFVDTPLHPHCFAIPQNDTFTVTISTRHTHPDHSVSFLVTSKPRGMSESSFTDVVGKTGYKQATLSWTPSAIQYGQFFFVCFLAVDDVGGASDQQCLTLVTATELVKVRLDTRSPNTQLFSPSTDSAHISFTKPISLPTTSRYVRIFKHSDDTLVETIDTSTSSQVTISNDGLVASFRLEGVYSGNATYYILLERGAFVDASVKCSGGGPVADGIQTKGDWTFITPQCQNDLDCHSISKCVAFECITPSTPPVDHCGILDNCDINALCRNTLRSFECECLDGFSGDGVSCVDIDECYNETTHSCRRPSKACVNTPGSFVCACHRGFSGDGEHCYDIDECDGVGICQHNEICVNTPGAFNCDFPIDHCVLGRHTCYVYALCRNTPGSFECECLDGFTGNGINCTDIDECAENSDYCHHKAICVNTHGSFECECLDGFTGDGVNCVDTNECVEDFDDCHDEASCSNTLGSFQCECLAGFTGDGINCADIDECAENLHYCHRKAICDNTPGSFECECLAGFAGDGINCTDIDECAENLDNCHHKAICVNTRGSFDCRTPPDYEYPDYCASSLDNCHTHADCYTTPGSFLCICINGYKGNGVNCTDIDECADRMSHSCSLNADCTNTPGSFECTCKDGFSGDGFTCDDVSSCTTDWPSQRNRWIISDEDWKGSARDFDGMRDPLPDANFNPSDTPIEQWEELISNYINSLNAWLNAASYLGIPGFPKSITFSETDPDKLWNEIRDFQRYLLNQWSKHFGFLKPQILVHCEDPRVASWVLSSFCNELAMRFFELVLDG